MHRCSTTQLRGGWFSSCVFWCEEPFCYDKICYVRWIDGNRFAVRCITNPDIDDSLLDSQDEIETLRDYYLYSKSTVYDDDPHAHVLMDPGFVCFRATRSVDPNAVLGFRDCNATSYPLPPYSGTVWHRTDCPECRSPKCSSLWFLVHNPKAASNQHPLPATCYSRCISSLGAAFKMLLKKEETP